MSDQDGNDFDPKILGGSVKRKIVNPDLQEERDKCDFDQQEMADFIFGPEVVRFVKKMHPIVKDFPELHSKVEYYELSRRDQMLEWWRRIRRVMEEDRLRYLITGWLDEDQPLFAWSFMYSGTLPTALHQTMFLDCLTIFADEDQKAHYLPQANNLNIIGCYAQTELGHGSNVAGLETTATFDIGSQEFVIHCPTIKAAKFWPGALGVHATHAVVFARCIVQESDYGVQAFIVQVRDLNTHEPLPGVEVGDIG